ncbi:MAG: hypothetical protein U9R08_05750 [Nanoarchaeota archaeon]|nr:hypothetical protein [Nanoarchaeota archaeon]
MSKKDLLKKSVLIGIGLGVLTKSKVEKYVKDLKKEGYLDAKEGKKLAKEFLSEGRKLENKLKASLKKRVKIAKSIKSKIYKKKAVKKKSKSPKKKSKSTKKKVVKKKATKKKTVKKRTAKKKTAKRSSVKRKRR